MLTLPYQCQPYPDEIVGSWFSRLFLHNGSGAFNALTIACGYHPIVQKSMFDLLDYDERLGHLLKALGISYEHMLRNLTTLPYWMAFDQMRGEEIVAGTETLHRIFTPSQKGTNRQILLSRFNIFSNQTSHQPKYCPVCLDTDYHAVGEPYWHRTHQLRNLFFCPIHWCSLRTSCSKCQKTMVTLKQRLIDLPRLKCSCGNDLTVPLKPSSPNDFLVRLAEISVQALECKRPLWYHDQVREVLKSKFKKNSYGAQGGYDDVLMKIFGFQEKKSGTQFAVMPNHPDRPFMRLRTRWPNIGAPECCAIMAMMGLDFEISSMAFETASALLKNQKRPITTVAQARMAMENKIKKYPLAHPARFPHTYWFLVINDLPWIKAKFPNLKPSLLKSTEYDRKLFSNILKRTDVPPAYAMRRAICSRAAIRLACRDAVWLREKLKEFRKSQKRKIPPRVDLSNKVRDIESEIKNLVQAEGIPVRITMALLASKFTLSKTQVIKIISDYPHLKEQIKIANLDRARRSLIWAAQCILNEGRKLNIAELIQRGGNNNYPLIRPIAQKIIAEMQPN